MSETPSPFSFENQSAESEPAVEQSPSNAEELARINETLAQAQEILTAVEKVSDPLFSAELKLPILRETRRLTERRDQLQKSESTPQVPEAAAAPAVEAAVSPEPASDLPTSLSLGGEETAAPESAVEFTPESSPEASDAISMAAAPTESPAEFAPEASPETAADAPAETPFAAAPETGGLPPLPDQMAETPVEAPVDNPAPMSEAVTPEMGEVATPKMGEVATPEAPASPFPTVTTESLDVEPEQPASPQEAFDKFVQENPQPVSPEQPPEAAEQMESPAAA